VCVCVCSAWEKPTECLFGAPGGGGAVWLRSLTNLDVPFGAGACTLKLCRIIWCGKYLSAVTVSTSNNPPPKNLKVQHVHPVEAWLSRHQHKLPAITLRMPSAALPANVCTLSATEGSSASRSLHCCSQRQSNAACQSASAPHISRHRLSLLALLLPAAAVA
jgi:hypothetical protein